MHFKKLDLNLLVSLDALLTELNVTRAADRLHVTQSAMSNSLARLRDYFKDDLLTQVGRRMEMTPPAERLQPEVRDVLARIDGTISMASDFDPTNAAHLLTVQASDYTLQTLMPHVLALAEAQGSRVRFEMLPVDGLRAIDQGKADIVILPRAHCHPQHPTETLLHETMLCAVWRESALAQGELSFERYMEAAHVVARLSVAVPPVFDGWLAETYGRPRRVEVVSYSLASLPHLVVGTERIATVHGLLARAAATALPIVLRPMPAPMPRLELAMQWPASRQGHGSQQWLRKLFKQAAVELDASLPPLPHDTRRVEPLVNPDICRMDPGS